jgi:hypothetical protein
MIIYPAKWGKKYEKLADSIDIDVSLIINELMNILKRMDVRCLSFSGGLDSTIMLCVMKMVFDNVNTYTISSREDHPDIQFARIGSECYKTNHHEFIVEPTKKDTDQFTGDNAVRQFFENVGNYTNEIICCDGIDEFMCGYYDHLNGSFNTYEHYLSRLTPDHLIPLNVNSGKVKVFLPYLSNSLISIYRMIPLRAKISGDERKFVMRTIARKLNIPQEVMDRNKYGFCDAFREKNK